MALELIKNGDKELWCVKGEAPGGGEWIVPVYVEYFLSGAKDQERKFVRITRAINIMGPMVVAALKSRLTPYMLASQAGFCMLAESALHEIATKAPGVTPEYYLKFPEEASILNTPERDKVSEMGTAKGSTEAFLKFVHTNSQIVPWATLKLVWRAIVQNSQVWLSEKKEPIDFGFVELVPTPYRVNWCQILKTMHPEAAQILVSRQLKPDTKERKLVNSGFYRSLRNGVLLSLNKHLAIQWRIEAVHHESWWKVMDELETLVRNSRGPVGYAKQVALHVHKRLERNIDIFTRWVREANKTAATVGSNSLYGAEFLKAYVPKGHVKAKAPPSGPVRVVESLKDEGVLAPDTPEDVEDEASERLLQVPNLQSPAENLRDTG